MSIIIFKVSIYLVMQKQQLMDLKEKTISSYWYYAFSKYLVSPWLAGKGLVKSLPTQNLINSVNSFC